MKLLIVSDAWYPQVNGVVRTLEATARELRVMGHTVKIVGPEPGLFTVPAPSYPEIRLEFFAGGRLRNILDRFQPDYIHISTEGPLGLAMRRLCLRQKRPFSTAYHTCFPEYVEARMPFPFRNTAKLLTYQWIKRFHAPSGAVMVATPTMDALLRKRRVHRLRRWSRGVDTELFHPSDDMPDSYKSLPRPIFLYVGRVAVEKNLDAFLSLDLPGSKVVIGDGPQEAAFRQNYPAVHFLGKKSGVDLSRHYAGADVFVFPSKTDTFGLVLLEALACGLAVTAYPVQGPRDVFADSTASAFVALEDDLKSAALKAAALKPDKEAAHLYVKSRYSWGHCTRQFLDNLQAPSPFALRRMTRFERAQDLVQSLWAHLRRVPKFYPTLYRFLTTLVAPLLPLYLRWRVHLGKEDAGRLKERFGEAARARPIGKLVWLHAASVGEALSLLPLLEAIAQHPTQPSLLLTTGTRSSATLLEKRLPPSVIHHYIPLDTMQATGRFMEHWKPDVALLVESELWPNLLGKIRKYAIPAALINARMSARSAARWERCAGLWIAALLRVFSVVLAQSEGDALRLRGLGAYGARCVGNLKAAAAPLPVGESAFVALKTAAGARPLWLMASTHEGEDALAFAAHQTLQKDFPDLLTIIVPRHPARAEKVAALAAQQGLIIARRSKGVMPLATHQIYLADSFGELGLFYRLCPLVCVAGSFVAVAGHNPLEPAAFGASIIFGPDMRNFSDVAADMVAAGAALQVADGVALTAALQQALLNPTLAAARGEKARAFADAQRQVLPRIMAELQPLLDKALFA